ncbi:MAG: DUF177 domain-containing protein [Rhodospirillaceae bacterium]|nr:MAG: DUF177 domain-containing protein [Rhodospirillaceae bacterium]
MTGAKLPFSFPVEVLQLPAGGRVYTLRADDQERADVAAELELVAVGRLIATVTLMPATGGGVEARARFEADITQTCVVTLQPLATTVNEEVIRHFTVPRRKAPTVSAGAKAPTDMDTSDGWIDPNEEVPDPIVDGCIDLGAMVVEELSLAIDPYPRAPGASFSDLGVSVSPPLPQSSSPFAALAGFRTAEPAQRRSKTRPKVRR